MRTVALSNSCRPSRGSRPFCSLALLGIALLVLGPAPRIQSQAASDLSSSSIPDRILNRVDESNLTTIHGSTHPAVRTAQDKGRLSPSVVMGDLILVLNRSESQQTALNALNEAQYDPSSPQYHHWLTPQEFGAAYGVSQIDLDAISSWLQYHGFIIQEIPPSHTSIRFSGTVAQVEETFHTQMHAIESGGQTHIANISEIQIPAALTPVVVGVKALHNFFPKAQHHTAAMLSRDLSGGWTQSRTQTSEQASAQANGVSGLPDAQSSASSAIPSAIANARPDYADGGYQLLVPYDMATIYNYKSLWAAATPITGTGQTIALAGTSNILLSDVATFRAATGLPAKVPTVIITNTDPGTTALLDDRFENTLDVEWSGAAAPGANIVLVTSSQTSQTTDALYASESYIINNSVAKIMSVSYGECELGMGTAGNTEYLNLWNQAYTQGIAVFVSSGDSMAAVCDDGDYNPSTDYAAEFGLTVSGMTSTPYNVSVGGTDFNSTSANWSSVNSSTNMSNAIGYIPEIPWNDTLTNPIALGDLNQEFGVNDSAEGMANYLLKNYGISNGTYQGLIPPVGGSGGVSNCTVSSNGNPATCTGGYPKPAWQTGVTGILSSDKRAVPDISFFASNGFMGVAYLICDTQPPGYSTPIICSYPANALDMAVGGTSVSSPVMAGVMALINQKAGSSQGNPNTVLYGLAAKQTYANCSAETGTVSSACYFNDIDTSTIASPCFVGSVNCTAQTAGDALGILPGYAATVGYDKATGLGSLNVANVVNGWPGSSAVSPASVASLSPTSLTFPSTAVSSSPATQIVTLTNSGTASMSVSGISITGANASSFSQTNTCGSTLAVSASCAVTVTFTPAAAGALTAAISFVDNAANSPQTAALSGTGSTPAISISPTSLAFPTTNVGASSATKSVTVTNSGSVTLTISGVTITGANTTSFKGSNGCGGTLAANASCSVSFYFKPTAPGALTAAISFADNAANSPQTVVLSGTGGSAPVVSLSPASLAFASTNVGVSSAAQLVTLTNSGTAALTLSSVTVGGTNPTSFLATNNCGASLAATASCTVSIIFKPLAAGALSASLSFTDSAANSPQAFALTGTGVGVPAASLSPGSLSFASTNVGASSAAQTVTLTNTGTGALTISSVTVGGANVSAFALTNNCGSSLAVSASCTVLVTFKPAAAGPLSASLNFADNAANTPQAVTLSGTGVGVPLASLSPTSLAFASTNVGASAATQAVTLSNTGTAALTISSISISGTNPTSFSQTNNCGSSLATSSSCAVTVTFRPAAGGALSASLSVADTATGSPHTAALSGTGVVALPAVSLSSTTQNFPITAYSASAPYNYSPALAISLTNTGSSALTISSVALGGTNPTSFSQVNNCPASLAAAASCTALVRFAPTVAGSKTATLVFTDNASPTTQSVTLSGTGAAAPAITLSSTTLSFGAVSSGTTSAVQTTTVTNSSTTTPINLTSIVLSGAGAASFVDVSNCGTTLAASSSCIIMVEFAPTAKTAVSASLTVTANNPAATSTVALSGTGD
ncbi:MAG: choice-of-anchor D domain-containing protein [Terracidiphilus sp.]|jgi:subtilase family serine protease